MERGCVLWDGQNLLVEHLPDDLAYKGLSSPSDDIRELGKQPEDVMKVEEPDAKQALVNALELAGGNKSKAAKLLSIDRSTLYRRMRRFQITPDWAISFQNLPRPSQVLRLLLQNCRD